MLTVGRPAHVRVAAAVAQPVEARAVGLDRVNLLVVFIQKVLPFGVASSRLVALALIAAAIVIAVT